MPIFNENAEG